MVQKVQNSDRKAPRNGFERRKEQKKEGIRRAALELFKHHGVSKVSVKDVAVKASASPVTIFNHFGSKEGLVRDVVKRHISDLVAKYEAVLEGETPFMERLETVILDKKNMMRSYNSEFIQTMISDDKEIQAFFEDVSSDMMQCLARFLEEGQKEGCINPELSQEAIMLYFDVLSKGIRANSRAFSSPQRNEEIVRQFSELYLYGLMGRSDRVKNKRVAERS